MKRKYLLARSLAFIAAAAACVCSCTHEDGPLAEDSSYAGDTKSIQDKYPWRRLPLDYRDIPGIFVIEKCDLENPGVRAFLDSTDYSEDRDYRASSVEQFSSTASDRPQPLIIRWKGEAASIELSSSPLFDKDVVRPQITDSSATVFNLIPGIIYYYRVLDENGAVIKRACVCPTGPMRMINGLLKNVRDLGGWKADGGHIAYGKVYRGARVDDIQSDTSAMDIFINTLRVGVDLDLRGLPPGVQGGSGEKNPWKSGDPVEYCNIKLWNYMHPSSRQYTVPEIVDGTSADQYQLAIRKIINWLGDGKVVYFHCHGGADRTGTLAFLIEALLGVSESDLSKDFELTTYAGSVHKRDGSAGWFFYPMVKYLRTFAPEGTIKDQVMAWAKTQHSPEVAPLSDEEIAALRNYLIVND